MIKIQPNLWWNSDLHVIAHLWSEVYYKIWLMKTLEKEFKIKASIWKWIFLKKYIGSSK